MGRTHPEETNLVEPMHPDETNLVESIPTKRIWSNPSRRNESPSSSIMHARAAQRFELPVHVNMRLQGRRCLVVFFAVACVWLTSLFAILGYVELIEEETDRPLAWKGADGHSTRFRGWADQAHLTHPPAVTAVPPPALRVNETQDPVTNPSESSASRPDVEFMDGGVSHDADELVEQGDPATLSFAVDNSTQGLAVKRLTAQSECQIQTFTGRSVAIASSVYSGAEPTSAMTNEDAGKLAAQRHGAALAFDADTTTAWHGACGLPSAPWWLTYRFPEPTTMSTVKLTSDAPADFPLQWELQGSVDGERFTRLLSVSRDRGIASDCRGAQLRKHRCDRPQTRAYEVRNPGHFLFYRVLVHRVSNHGRSERNCLQLAEVCATTARSLYQQ